MAMRDYGVLDAFLYLDSTSQFARNSQMEFVCVCARLCIRKIMCVKKRV